MTARCLSLPSSFFLGFQCLRGMEQLLGSAQRDSSIPSPVPRTRQLCTTCYHPCTEGPVWCEYHQLMFPWSLLCAKCFSLLYLMSHYIFVKVYMISQKSRFRTVLQNHGCTSKWGEILKTVLSLAHLKPIRTSDMRPLHQYLKPCRWVLSTMCPVYWIGILP